MLRDLEYTIATLLDFILCLKQEQLRERGDKFKRDQNDAHNRLTFSLRFNQKHTVPKGRSKGARRGEVRPNDCTRGF